MVIPNSVKIDGNRIPVDVYEDGKVRVGLTTLEMEPETKQRIEFMDYELHFIPWQEQMFNLYEKAYKAEKKRIMS